MVAPHTCPHPRDVTTPTLCQCCFSRHLSTHTLVAHTLSHGATAGTLAQTHLQTTAGSLELWNPDGPGSASPTSMTHANVPLSSALPTALGGPRVELSTTKSHVPTRVFPAKQSACACECRTGGVGRVHSCNAAEGRGPCLGSTSTLWPSTLRSACVTSSTDCPLSAQQVAPHTLGAVGVDFRNEVSKRTPTPPLRRTGQDQRG
jgi:hypothetical protein